VPQPETQDHPVGDLSSYDQTAERSARPAEVRSQQESESSLTWGADTLRWSFSDSTQLDESIQLLNREGKEKEKKKKRMSFRTEKSRKPSKNKVSE
jgi:hypothetical protein